MADAGAGINMIGTDETSDLLVCIVGLVGKASRGQIPGKALGVGLV